METTERIEERWQFDTFYEFALYCSILKKQNINRNVVWVRGLDYQDHFKKGYALVEKQNYTGALKELYKALQVNPTGIAARFEIAQCLSLIGKLDQAKALLLKSLPFFIEASDTAHMFRALGFIFVEEEKWELATACYVKSLEYEEADLAFDEIKYIASKVGNSFTIPDADKVLEEANLPCPAVLRIKDKNNVPESLWADEGEDD